MKRSNSTALPLALRIAAFAVPLALFGCAAGNDPGEGIGGNGQGGNGLGGDEKPKTCDRGCPHGFSCEDGVCAGGDANALVFGVETVTVSGTITVDGQPPQPTEGCSANQVRLTFFDGPPRRSFRDPQIGSTVDGYVSCTSTDGSFSVRLPKGTYRALAGQYESATTFPQANLVAAKGLEVKGDTSGLHFDLKTVAIAGRLTVNGQPPQATEACGSDQVRVELSDDDGASFTGYVPCASSDGSFAVRVAPGKYTVRASQYTSETSFPPASFVVEPAFEVEAARSDIAWALSTVTVGGRLTVDGAAPLPMGDCTSNQVRVVLGNDDGASFTGYVPCTSTSGAFTVQVAPGKYRVVAGQYASDTTFPSASFSVDKAFEVSKATAGLAWDLRTVAVSGHLTVDGHPPTPVGDCTSNQVRLTFIDEAGASFDAYVACTALDGAFTARVAPGTYQVLASQYASSTDFPPATFVVDPAFEAKAGATNLTWALKTTTVAGHLTVDGQPPIAAEGCTSNQVRISLRDPSGGNFDGYIPCGVADGAFSARVAPGVYGITASQYASTTTFPPVNFGLVDAIRIR